MTFLDFFAFQGIGLWVTVVIVAGAVSIVTIVGILGWLAYERVRRFCLGW